MLAYDLSGLLFRASDYTKFDILDIFDDTLSLLRIRYRTLGRLRYRRSSSDIADQSPYNRALILDTCDKYGGAWEYINQYIHLFLSSGGRCGFNGRLNLAMANMDLVGSVYESIGSFSASRWPREYNTYLKEHMADTDVQGLLNSVKSHLTTEDYLKLVVFISNGATLNHLYDISLDWDGLLGWRFVNIFYKSVQPKPKITEDAGRKMLMNSTLYPPLLDEAGLVRYEPSDTLTDRERSMWEINALQWGMNGYEMGCIQMNQSGFFRDPTRWMPYESLEREYVPHYKLIGDTL